MNERIKQLALRAFQPINDITSEGVADRRTFNQVWFEHYNQKFAELIVRECAEIADTAEPFLASDLIKQHFGVKE
jgi:hypothetical protein